jgi:hypothetical protein
MQGEVLVVGAAIGSLVLVSTVVQLLGTTLRPPTPPEEPPPGPLSRTFAERIPARTGPY